VSKDCGEGERTGGREGGREGGKEACAHCHAGKRHTCYVPDLQLYSATLTLHHHGSKLHPNRCHVRGFELVVDEPTQQCGFPNAIGSDDRQNQQQVEVSTYAKDTQTVKPRASGVCRSLLFPCAKDTLIKRPGEASHMRALIRTHTHTQRRGRAHLRRVTGRAQPTRRRRAPHPPRRVLTSLTGSTARVRGVGVGRSRGSPRALLDD
jgi:hypothetical protein